MTQCVIEAERVQDEFRAGPEFGTEEGQRPPDSARRAGAHETCGPRAAGEFRQGHEFVLDFTDVSGSGSLLGPEAARGVEEARPDVGQAHELGLPEEPRQCDKHRRSRIHRRGTAEGDYHPARTVTRRVADHFRHALRRGIPRVPLLRPRQPHLRDLDDGVASLSPVLHAQTLAVRPGRRHPNALPAQYRRGPVTAVGNGEQDGRAAGAAHAAGHRARSLERREGPLERVGGAEHDRPRAVAYHGDMLLYSHEDCNGHRAPPGHPECGERLTGIVKAIREGRKDWAWAEPRPARLEELAAIHTAEHIVRVVEAFDAAPAQLEADTYVSAGTGRAAFLAAGAARDAARAALKGQTAAALVRPPGHHATRSQAMGFCLFNNVALAAMQAKRVLVVDWDVHHGNGTQDIFYDNPDVLYFSTHRWPFYPGTGARAETGSGRGLGATVNRPFPWNTSRETFKAEFAEVIEGPARRFDPELVLISAGFDAWKHDPIGGLNLEVEDFGELTRIVKGLKRPIASVLEGGYDLEALPACVLAHLDELARP